MDNSEKCKVLIVDDSVHIRDGLKQLLNIIHYTPDVAKNGLEAIDMANTNIYNLILMDISMPKLNGISAARIIRKELPHIKIIMMSMHMNKLDVFSLLKYNIVDGYILKEDLTKDLESAFNAVIEGNGYYSSDIRKLMQIN